MKNITKTNILFTVTVLIYIILVYSIRLLPAGMLSLNVLLILPEIILALPSICYVMFLKKDGITGCGCAGVPFSTALLSVVFGFCIIPVVSLINLISSFFVRNAVDDTLTMITDTNSLPVNLIVMAFIPAVVEEFIFRGVIFNGYKNRNPWKAALLSAMLFGLIHMNVNQFLYAFVVGIIFALLTYATGSIIPAVIAHFVINGTSVVSAYMMQQTDNTTQLMENAEEISELMSYVITFGVIIFMAIVAILVGIVIFRLICKRNRGIESVKMILKPELRKAYDESQGKFIDSYLLMGIGVCLIYIIVYDFIL